MKRCNGVVRDTGKWRGEGSRYYEHGGMKTVPEMREYDNDRRQIRSIMEIWKTAFCPCISGHGIVAGMMDTSGRCGRQQRRGVDKDVSSRHTNTTGNGR